MSENVVEVLSDIEHVLKVPTRYIGSTSKTNRIEWCLDNDNFIEKEISVVPAFLTLFREVVSNAIDEYIRTNGKFGNRIDIIFDGEYFQVTDNGRGISHNLEEKTHLPQSVVAFTQLKAGSNFKEQTCTVGMHGEGVSLVNIFSKHFYVETSDGIKKTYLECKDNMSSFNYKLVNCPSRLTRIRWKPDYEKLNIEENEINDYVNIIKKIVVDFSMSYQNIDFIYNKEKISIKSFKDYVSKYGLDFEFFSHNNIDLAIFKSEEFKQVSWVNGICTRRGGIHVDYIENGIKNKLRDLLIKKYKEIKPLDIKNKLFFIINIKNMKAPRFDNQTKEELVNNANDFESDLFNDIDFDKIAKKLYTNKEIIDNILDTYRVKEELKKRQELKNKEKKIKKIDIPKLIESNHKILKEKILYIAEGESAISNFLTCRSDNMAAFPLMGKITNSSDKDLSDLAKSKKIMDLVTVLGLKLSSKSIDNLQYGKIVLFTDQDHDGDAITCLLINLIYKCWPDLIKEGKLYKVQSPLVNAINVDTKKKKKFFSNEEFEKEKGNWKILEYNKGLGSLSEEDYKFSLTNFVKIVIDDETEEALEIAFGSSADRRKDWMMKG